MMGVLTYFLGFQIKQSERGISINPENYVKHLLKKYDINGSLVKTPMVPPNKLGPNLNGKATNETQYRANPKESHLIAVKRIFRYPYFVITQVLLQSQTIQFCTQEQNILILDIILSEIISKGDIVLLFHLPLQYQLADIFTKPLDEPTFKRLIVELGMLNIDSKPKASILTEEN
ncbi:hypothetical protein Tco_0309497 [Tanacetum coccineum]